jgi:hypothetical protein
MGADKVSLGMNDGEPAPLVHVGDGRFRLGNQMIEFRTEPGPVVLHLDAGGYAHYVMRRR